MSFTWSGDFETCNFWRPFAEDRQRVLAQVVGMRSLHEGKGIGVGGKSLTRALSQSWFPVPGVEIMIQVYPHHIHIKAEGGSANLETGFYDYINLGINNILALKKPFVNYNQYLNAYWNSTDKPAFIKLHLRVNTGIVEGEDVGPHESTTFPCNGEWETKPGYGASEFCNNKEIISRKKCQTWVKPSMFSGKLRLFVQALYGSSRTDYNTDELYPLFFKPLYFMGEQLHYWYLTGTSSGIYMTDDFDYYLIQISKSGVTAQRMIPNGYGVALQKQLIAYRKSGFPLKGAEMVRIEALILSTVELDNSSRPFKLGDFGEPLKGSPLFYGWHFNWTGSSAVIILHEDNLPEDQLWHAYEYELFFYGGSSEIPPNMVVKQFRKERGVWYGIHSHLTLIPDGLFGYMSAFVNPLKENSSGWDTNDPPEWEATIYKYFKTGDLVTSRNALDRSQFDVTQQPREVKRSNEVTVHPAGSGYYNWSPSGGLCGWLPTGAESLYRVYDWPEYKTKLFKVSDNLTEVEYDDDPNLKYEGVLGFPLESVFYEYFVRTGENNYEAPYPIGNGGTGSLRKLPLTGNSSFQVCDGRSWGQHAIDEGIIDMRYYDQSSSYTGEKINMGWSNDPRPIYMTHNARDNICDFYRARKTANYNGVITANISQYDCESVVIGKKIDEHDTYESNIQVYKNGRVRAEVIYIKWVTDPDGNKVVLNIYGPYPCRATRIYNQSLGDGDVSPLAPTENHHVRVEGDSRGVMYDEEQEDWYALSKYFEVKEITDPTAYFSATSKTCISNGNRTRFSGLFDKQFQDASETTDGYPAETSVGWI